MYMGDLVAASDNDAGEDGDHRKHARSKREQQAGPEKEGNNEPGIAALEELCNLSIVVFG